MQKLKLEHDSPDGMCVMAGCQFQAEKVVSWTTGKGPVVAPLCEAHMMEAWERTVPGYSRDTFTIMPISGADNDTMEATPWQPYT